MTRIYDNSALARRMNISAAVTMLAVLYGFVEAWLAMRAGPEGPGYGYLFALFFIAGGLYGFRQIWVDYSDMVVTLDADAESGKAAVAIWQPFRSKRIETSLDRFSEWRPYAKQTRAARRRMLLADHPDHPRPLQFEIEKGIGIEPAFRTLAGEALSSIETG